MCRSRFANQSAASIHTLLIKKMSRTRDAASADLPGVRVSTWIKACGGVGSPMGAFPQGTRVVIVGAGFSGVTLAGAAARSGAQVTLLEGHPDAGGRLRSETLAKGNSAPVFTHKAAMRFGQDSELLEMHLNTEGFTLKGPDFINIGTVPTILFDTETAAPSLWDDARGTVPYQSNIRKSLPISHQQIISK